MKSDRVYHSGRNFYKLSSLLLFFSVMFFWLFIGANSTAKAQSSEFQIKQQMETVKQLLTETNIVYFTADGQKCGSECVNNSCANCLLKNIMPTVPHPLITGAQVNAAKKYTAWTCVAYARWLYYNLFESFPEAGEAVSISNARCGDYVSLVWYKDGIKHTHAGVFYEWADNDHNKFYLYDGNHSSDRKIHYGDIKESISKVAEVKRSTNDVRAINNIPMIPRIEIKSGIYVIHSAWDDSICLDITGDSMENDANIQLYHRTNNEVQNFRVIKWNSDYYCVKSIFNGRWLDAKTPLGNNSNVKLYDTNTGTENYWFFEDAGGGYVYIRNKSGYYLDVQGDQAVDNANVQLYQFVGNNSQKWRLEEVTPITVVEDGTYLIQSALDNNYMLDIAGDSTENNANIQLFNPRSPSTVQQFRAVNHGAYYTFQSEYNNLWLDIKLPVADGSNVKLYETGSAAENQWMLEDAGDGYFYIRSNRDFYIHVDGEMPSDHANIQMYHFTGSDAQKWKLVKVDANQDTMKPTITSFIFVRGSNNDYTVTCTASDDQELSEIYIGSWNEKDGINNMVWQTQFVAGNTSTVTFTVPVQNGSKEVYYHTSAYARDNSGNISSEVQGIDYYIGDGGQVTIKKIFPNGVSETTITIIPEEGCGAYLDIEAEKYDAYLFDHWESDTGIFTNANSDHTTYIIPAGGATIYAIYMENPDYIPIEPGEGWTEVEYIPYYIDTAKCDIEYKYQYSQASVNSPGDGWVKGAEVNSHYENSGPVQEFNTEQTESDTYVYVGYYYYHYCGPNASTNYCNYEQTEKYTTYHNIGTSDDYIIEKTFYDNGGDCYSYQLKWRNDQSQYVYCADHRSPVYYRKYQYQPRILVKEYMWTKESDWTVEANPNPELNTSVSYRIRLKQFSVSFDANGGSYSTESQVKYCGVALILPAEIPVRNEYAFIGWNTKADGSGTSYDPGSEYQEDAAVTLYAQWRASGTIYLPADLKTIEEEAFSGLPVGIVHVPSGCVEIQNRAFADCEQLKSVYIPASVKTVALDAFENCPKLTIHAPTGSIAIKVAKYNDITYVEE